MLPVHAIAACAVGEQITVLANLQQAEAVLPLLTMGARLPKMETHAVSPPAHDLAHSLVDCDDLGFQFLPDGSVPAAISDLPWSR